MERTGDLTVGYPFHYLGSAKTLFLMGDAMGQGMVELPKKKSSAGPATK